MTILDTITAPPKVDPSIRRNRDPHNHDGRKSFDAAMASAAGDDDSRQVGARDGQTANGTTSELPHERIDNNGSQSDKNADNNPDQTQDQAVASASARHAPSTESPIEVPAEPATSADTLLSTPVDTPELAVTVASSEQPVTAALTNAVALSDATGAPGEAVDPPVVAAPPADAAQTSATSADAVAGGAAGSDVAPGAGVSPEQASDVTVATTEALDTGAAVTLQPNAAPAADQQASAAAAATVVRSTKPVASDATPVVAPSVTAEDDAAAASALPAELPADLPAERPSSARLATPAAAATTPTDAASFDAASAEPASGEPAPLSTAATTSTPAPDIGSRLSQQLATRELFQRIEQHRRSLDGAIEMEIVTERFGSLRIEAIEGRDGVHLSLKSDSNDQRALAELAQQLRHEFDQSDVDLAGFDVGGRSGSNADSAQDERDLDETAIESNSTHSRLNGIAGGLDLRL